MIAEILQEARDRIASQPYLWTDRMDYNPDNCTCVGVALYERAEIGVNDDKLYRTFLEANDIPIDHFGTFLGIGEWNDEPGRTVAEAVAALDKAIEYARSQEQG